MKIEAQRPYGLPPLGQEVKENSPDKAQRAPERTVTIAGDQFELSKEQQVTQSALDSAVLNATDQGLAPERLSELRNRVATGQYLTPRAALLTAESLSSFHK